MKDVPEDLLLAAKQAFDNAYAQYSNFHVGSALRTLGGTVYQGANVENASYGLARCAEQSAIQAMATAGERSFTEIVVYSASTPPATPCGACRQILFEFSPDATVYTVNGDAVINVFTVKDLLPGGFSSDALDRD